MNPNFSPRMMIKFQQFADNFQTAHEWQTHQGPTGDQTGGGANFNDNSNMPTK
jgi:hypothetical protein